MKGDITLEKKWNGPHCSIVLTAEDRATEPDALGDYLDNDYKIVSDEREDETICLCGAPLLETGECSVPECVCTSHGEVVPECPIPGCATEPNPKPSDYVEDLDAHNSDEQCFGYISHDTHLCTVCGADHSQAMPCCGGRGYHAENCPEIGQRI